MATITEDTPMEFKNYSDLMYYETGTDYIDLYVKGDFAGYCKVWLDGEMGDREYICLNHTIVYLDTLECINPE